MTIIIHYPWFPTIHHIYFNMYYNIEIIYICIYYIITYFMTIIIIFTQEYGDYLYYNTIRYYDIEYRDYLYNNSNIEIIYMITP